MRTTCRAVSTAPHAALAMLAMLAMLAGGCAAPAPPATSRDVAPSLVMLAPDMAVPGGAAGGEAWESRRLDASLGVEEGAPARERYWVEIDTYDRRSTLTGRVQEHSRTRTRTIRLRSGLSR